MPADFTLTVNGSEHRVRCDPQTPLLYVLRNDLGMVGTRFGCGLGLCGACNVLLDGQPVHSCDTPIWAVGEAQVTTVEALGSEQSPSRLQQSFLSHQAGQCGFCLSGVLMSATALLRRVPDADEPAVRAALDGNLCRCGAHNRIVRAVLAARPGALPATDTDAAIPATPTAVDRDIEAVPSPSLAANPRLSSWVSFADPGYVTVLTGKVELGQGIVTALAQLAAEGLSVAPSRIRVAAASTEAAPDEGYTAGSLSVQHSGAAVSQVCARVRELCCAAAAAALDAAPGDVRLFDGTFSVPGAAISYWDLPTETLLDSDIDRAAVTDIVAGSAGRSQVPPLPRVDLPAKVTGASCYLGDLVLPGMLHGRVVRPPSRGATLLEAPIAATEAMEDVHRVIRQRDFLAVLADREESALRAASELAADARWSEQDSLPDESAIAAFLVDAPAATETLYEEGTEEPVGADTVRVSATFSRPYLAHASIATSTALAWEDAGVLRVWTNSQGIFHLRAALAAALRREPSTVIVQHVESAGCYGHNGADDAAYDAATLACAVPGRPVRVVWSRQDEFGWSPLAPAMRVRIDARYQPAGPAGTGTVCDWRHEIWSNGHTSRPGSGVDPALLGGALQRGIDVPPALDPPLSRGSGSGRNAIAGYDVGRQLVRIHRLTTMPLRTSAMRSLGAHLNVFAIESTLDELAELIGRDPLEFRLAHLRDPRGRRVLELAAERAGWGTPLDGADIARGLGYARYKGTGAYCAVVAEVQATREVRVRRLTVAVDVGRAVNPDGVVNQIEGGAIQSLSWTLKERVAFDRRRVTSDTWESYPIVAFSEVPPVEVAVVDSTQAPLGAGEAATGPTAAAIGNALAVALGIRVRELPLTPDAIVRAISET